MKGYKFDDTKKKKKKAGTSVVYRRGKQNRPRNQKPGKGKRRVV